MKSNRFNMLRYRAMMLVFVFSVTIITASAQGTWSPLTNTPPNSSGGLMLLLSDGSVMVKSSDGPDFDGVGNIWNKLTPDATGSYINGTWSPMATMTYTRLYFSSRILKDGRIYVAGGEYGTGGSFGEIYNPVTDTWTIIGDSVSEMYDANSELLPDGEVLQAIVGADGTRTAIYNPQTGHYRHGATCLKYHDESCWVRLPDSSVLFVDLLDTTSERYIPSQARWISDGNVPVFLYSAIGEAGPAFMLPDGRAFFLGASGHNAYYTPSGNTTPGVWAAAPDFPNGFGMPDAAGAMMANGKILCAASPHGDSLNGFPNPTAFFEFDYRNNSFTQVGDPYNDGNDTISEACYVTNMLDLPDGSVLYTELGTYGYFVYTPAGAPVASGKPTISNISRMGCNLFSITGTLFNGISEGAAYGDDWQMATNFPIVQLKAGGNVYYARSFNWNSNGVQNGNVPDTAQFTLPSSITSGVYSLVVIANGIASDPVNFTVPNTGLTSSLTPPAVCSNTEFIYIPASDSTGTAFTWTRPAVTGITNPAITNPQTITADETLVNNTPNPITVVYNYVATGSSCSLPQQVAVVVNPTPTVSLIGPDTICAGHLATLIANGGTDYQWNDNNLTAVVNEYPTSTTTYSVTVSNDYSCQKSASKTVNTKICVGIESIAGYSNSISVQPNPAHSEAKLIFSISEPGTYTIKLFDIFGRTIRKETTDAVSGENQYALHFDGLAKGVYPISVQKDGLLLKARVVVQ